MNIQLVVVADNATKLQWVVQHHEKHLQMRRKRKGVYILQNGLEVYYMTTWSFETWKIGRTYTHLIDYLMGNDLFYHSGITISREQLKQLLDK